MAAPFDKAFKLFAEEEDLSLLRIVAKVHIPNEALVEHLDRELDLATLRVDHLYRVTGELDARAIHMEAFSNYHSDWRRKLSRYGALIWAKYEINLSSFMFLLTDHGVPAELQELVEVVAGDLELRLRVRIIRMWEVPASDLLETEDPKVLAWVPLTHHTPRQLHQAMEKVASCGNPEIQTRMALLFGLRYGEIEVLDEMLTDEVLKESAYYQKILHKGLEQGLEQGERQSFRRLLTHRFGNPPEWVDAKLHAASLADLQRWSNQLFDARSLEEALA